MPMKNIVKLTIFGVMFALAACGPRRDDSKKEAEKANDEKLQKSDLKKDADWAVGVADAGMLEVRVAELAKNNSTSSDVRSFAEMMLKDHTAANDELKKLASQKSITLPTNLSNKSQNKYDDLAKKKGKDFDDAYTDMMVDDHKKTVDEFKKEADKGEDTEIKSWASEKLSTLEHHLDMAKQIADKVDKLSKK
jgi:putative membrane protein